MQLFQLIYKSKKRENFPSEFIPKFTQKLCSRNEAKGITGILLFDGEYFLQVLEGDQKQVMSLMSQIEADERHNEITVILKEPIPKREHRDWGMKLILTSKNLINPLTQEIIKITDYLRTDRSVDTSKASKIIQAFTNGLWTNSNSSEERQSDKLLDSQIIALPTKLAAEKHCFAFQPIYDAYNEQICCLEGLIRGDNGESPAEIFSGLTKSEVYTLDMESKFSAINHFCRQEFNGMLSLNLLPGTLFENQNAVYKLVEHCQGRGLAPERLIFEITEQEAFINLGDFMLIVDQIRATGIKVAIDDFGSGYAGLSLLSKIQPHILKIDRSIISKIHLSGPQQAIVEAMKHISDRLGIEVVAEGVETLNEFDWLLQRGIQYYQGYYFASPMSGNFSVVDKN
ncbi:diguanylate phosphodiesterase [Methylophaga sp.]|uniref:diguanylate phosphodiesterase n=1 Tax=Methylophaga sp. TaxID=2024840 RepID=UPI003F6A0812